MFRCHPLPIYLTLVTVILATSGRGASLCRQDQSAALLSLKASFRFNDNSAVYYCGWVWSPLSSWKAGTNCCTWEGVTCDGTSGDVTALDLTDLCISGNLSSPDIFKLTSLRFLSLAYNNFDASPWPSPGFEQLKDLKYLDLSYSGLSGDLPIENGQLSNLVTLNLSGLHLKDLNLETLIDHLGSLQTLYLDDAYMSVRPTDLARTSSSNTTSGLKELSMWGCTITSGQFDTFLTDLLFRSKLANLVKLELSDFDLKNLSLYTLMRSLGKLQNIFLGNVNISASPTDLAYASSTNTTSGLKELTMWGCTITSGQFDTFLTNLLFRSKLANLVTLELSDLAVKNFSLYSLISSLGKLQTLYLENMNISVSPSDLAHASSANTASRLKELTMWECTITSGQFDTFLTKIPFFSNLIMLDLSSLDLKYLSFDAMINNLGSLQKLYLDSVNISVSSTDLASTSSANTASGLKELRMQGCTITSGQFDTFLTDRLFPSKLANLVMLELWYFDLKNLSLYSLIGSLGQLQTLFLGNVNISVSPTDLAYASSTNTTSGLKELSMWGCTITSGNLDIVLTKLPLLSNLVKLDLALVLDLKNMSFDALINNLGSLQKMYLHAVNISVSPIRLVHSSSTNTTPGLQELRMTDCGLTGTFPSWIFHTKRLTVLDVSQNENLCGELPEFVEGSALQELKLSGTKLSGKIPESIGNLRNLTMLDLSNCQFNGTIPHFPQWPMIQSIDLSGNNLIGSLASDGYRALPNLTTLDLSNNSISGVIPASLFSHPSLESLDLSQNNFTGNLLLYPNISSNLASINLSNNKLQGPIPKLLSELVGTYSLDLSSNNFTGTVDLSFIKNCKELSYVSLSYNKLSVVEEDSNHSYTEYPFIWDLGLASCNLSYVPKFLMHQSRMSDLDLSNNNIGGHIPDWIWGIGQHLSLNLSHNLFTSVDTNLSNSLIFDLDLNSNMLEGPIPLPPSGVHRLDYSNNCFNSSITPKFWSSINSVVSLSLSHNNLIGEISNLICSATDVGVLDLSFNNLTGLMPPCLLEHNTRLEILNLRGNNFHGSLPQEINDTCALQIIDLNNNKLEGKMPVSLVNCHMLQVLDVGNNLIVDTYPEWLGVLPLLKVLVLKSNHFHGPIDYYGMNKQRRPFFPELQVLDLSSNSFNGSISTRFFKQFKAMMVVSSGALSMYVGILASSPPPRFRNGTGFRNGTDQNGIPYYRESITVTIKGQETTLVQILSVFMSLDLSNNNFQGTIPNEIGDLKFLKGLNLSRNSFTGGIPDHIANMLQLESLDLSYNQLSGEIPPAMSLMSFLEVLNLSYNHLSGMIPHSSQFLTFPETSFLGNDGLCGKPLPRLCATNHTPSDAATPGSSKELNWEFLSVEAGVVSGMVIVFATTLLWGSGRRWLYWQVDKFLLDVLQQWIRGRHK